MDTSNSLAEGKMEFVKILMLVISVSWCANNIVGAADVAPCNFPAIFNFGGSNSDTGGLSAALDPIPPPNGETFFKKPAGRASNGRLIIDFIESNHHSIKMYAAEHLKMPYLSPYLDSVEANFAHGANFATMGATLKSNWSESFWTSGLSPFNVDSQIKQHFDQFKNRTIDLYNKGKDTSALPKPEDFSKALYTFDTGDTDLSVGFRRMSTDEIRAKLIPEINEKLSDYIQFLYKTGARTFLIHNTGPIGCLPNTTVSISNPKPGFLDRYGCVKSQNEIAVELNKQIKNRVIKLRTQLPEAAIVYVDVYAAEYKLISSAKCQGFTDPLKICCGVHQNGNYVKCGSKGSINGKTVYASSCKNPSTYVSWDGIHYTEAANHWIANWIINGSLSDPQVPITSTCNKY